MTLVVLLALGACDGDTCEPVLQDDDKTQSGLEYCDEYGAVNRTSAETCVGDPRTTVPPCKSAEGTCAKDADCDADQACGTATEGPFCRCYDVCGSDADCGEDQACWCRPQGGSHDLGSVDQCLPATCRTGADCASGECGAATDTCGDGGLVVGFHCRTAGDDCRTNDDCAQPAPVCTYSTGLGRWTCQESATCD